MGSGRENNKGVTALYVGEWINVAIGDYKAVGYVSHMECYSSQIEIMKVARIKGDIIEWSKPTHGSYDAHRLKPIGTLLDHFQDKSTLINMSLDTKDKEWFEELTGKKMFEARV
jgi:hypothetical protein